jgi:hypothetical protein
MQVGLEVSNCVEVTVIGPTPAQVNDKFRETCYISALPFDCGVHCGLVWGHIELIVQFPLAQRSIKQIKLYTFQFIFISLNILSQLAIASLTLLVCTFLRLTLVPVHWEIFLFEYLS